MRAIGAPARLAFAGAVSVVGFVVVMCLYAVAGVRWSTITLLPIALASLGAGLWLVWRGRQTTHDTDAAPDLARRSWTSLALLGLTAVLALYGLMTARMTCGDLVFFWAPKAAYFLRAGTIDLAYLANPHSFYAHSDYPPLYPLLLAWGHLPTGSVSYWSGLWVTFLCLAGIVALIWSAAKTAAIAAMGGAILSYTIAISYAGGGGDPLVLFFLSVAVASAVLVSDRRTAIILMAVAMTGLVLTKVEGIAVVIALALALPLSGWRLRDVALSIAPAAAAIGIWLSVMSRAGLIDTYKGAGALTFTHLGTVLSTIVKSAAFGAWWLPWIAPLAIVLLGDFRRARLPLIAFALTIGSTVYFYLHGEHDPTWWIKTSAPRVLLTPLTFLLFAAAAAHAGERGTR